MGRALGRAIGRHRRGQQEDSGFTLIELMVAILVFFIAIPPITYALVGAFSITAADKDRVVASDLLSQALDNVRSLPFGDVATGTTTSTQSVNGTTFTITQTVKPIAPPEQSTDVCGASTNDNGSADYLLVSVSVAWPQTDATPALGRTMLAPPAAVIASGDAEVILEVFSADGDPADGIPVTINTTPAQTVTTDSNGCAAFPYLSAGQAYTLTATGYVNANQQPASVTTPVLSLDETYEQTTGITWDLATTLTAPVQTDCLLSTSPSDTYGSCPATTDVIYPTSCTAGASPCSGSSANPVPVVFVPTGHPSDRIVSGANPAASPENDASATGFPYYTTNYEAWSGTCADAEPAADFVEGLTSIPSENALMWPGNPVVTIFAQPLTSSSYGQTVTVTHGSDSSCTSGETYTYSVPSSLPAGDTTMALALPAGTQWTFQRPGGSPVANVVVPPPTTGGLAL
jgi:type II secretory pathway pseudopilin PulG